ncbi:MFS transporter [Armatimonas sp.]|uniref:MFS transporter n=1 Tax=Armatimonas sp. TaxID=1872638 RepID=UPI003750F247
MSDKLRLRLLLSVMMFCLYAVWGAWTPIMAATLGDRLGATGVQIGAAYGVLWLACIISPFIGGQLVDRFMPSQIFLGISSAVCAGAAWMMSQQHSYGSFMLWMWVWALFFAPTLGITNSIAMSHLGKEVDREGDNTRERFVGISKTFNIAWAVVAIGSIVGLFATGNFSFEGVPTLVTLGVLSILFIFFLVFQDLSKPADVERSFSVVRTAGTIGWIISAIVLTIWLKSSGPVAKGTWAPFEEMQLTAAFGVILTIIAFFLPNTPPSTETKDPWAFKKAFVLFKTVPGFSIFLVISLIVSTEFQFYYTFSGPFMEDSVATGGLGIDHSMVSFYKSIAQWAEILCLGVLTPLSLKKLGLRKTLVLGTLAWPIRYFMYAIGQPTSLVLASNVLHGVGFAFVFVTSYLFVDRIAPRDIRASAQSLFMLVTLGIGNWLGTLFSGWLKDHYTTPEKTNWPMIFLIPAALTTACAIAFWFTFKEPQAEERVAEI